MLILFVANLASFMGIFPGTVGEILERFPIGPRPCQLNQKKKKALSTLAQESGQPIKEKESLQVTVPLSVVSPSTEQNPSPASSALAMANYEVDPRPFLLSGFRLEAWPPVGAADRPHRRLRAFVGPVQKTNEGVAVAVLHPEVAKEDFRTYAPVLREYLLRWHGVRSAGIEPCPLGAAFVSFDSCLERDRIIREGERQFGPYTLRFVKHDEGENATDCELDRVAWLMLLNFPLDCRHTSVIEHTVLGFGNLLHIRDSTTKARVIMKVLLHDSNEVPDDVLVTVGIETAARSFTVLVVRLASDWVVPVGDELPPPKGQYAHPLPPSPLRWMGYSSGMFGGGDQEASLGGVRGNGGTYRHRSIAMQFSDQPSGQRTPSPIAAEVEVPDQNGIVAPELPNHDVLSPDAAMLDDNALTEDNVMLF